jgi:hypothetical protein
MDIPSSIASSLMAFTADVKVLNKSKQQATMYLKPTYRVLVTKDNAVSSISKLDLNNISEQIIKGGIISISSKDGSEQKVATIDKIKVVTRHDKQVLKMWISNDDITVNGQFAKETLNYSDIEDNNKSNFVVLRRCPIVRTICPRGLPCRVIRSCD